MRSEDQGLMCAGGHLDGLSFRAVPGHGPQLVPLGPHHVREGVRISGVALGTRGAVTLLEPRHLPRVQPIHLVPGRNQRLHPQAPVSLDRDHHLARVTVVQVLADQLVQPGDPGDPLGQPPGGQLAALLVLDLHIVVILSPVIPDEQHLSSPPELSSDGQQPTGERLAL